MKKKLCALALCVIMVVALAAPALAAEPAPCNLVINSYTGIWLGYGATRLQMANVYGNDTISAGRNVTSWDDTGTDAQLWMLKNLGNENYIVSSKLRDAYGNEYVMNRNTNNNKCIVWPLSTAITADTVIVYPGPNLTQIIQLKFAPLSNKYFSPDAMVNGALISWGPTPYETQ